jgi:hypothetical protein
MKGFRGEKRQRAEKGRRQEAEGKGKRRRGRGRLEQGFEAL